jgi:NADH dehydrogenase [ubiquinone] 1 alpha subcomplex assembly factor 1
MPTITTYLTNSYNYLKQKALLQFSQDHTKPLQLFSFKTTQDLQRWVVGSDADFGGSSCCYWGQTEQGTALMFGTLDTTTMPSNPKLKHTGYAGIRSRTPAQILMHQPRIDVSLYRYLKIRARGTLSNPGDERQWFLNLRTDSVYPTFVWQHKLYFQTPGEWEDVLVPFRDFVLTSHGKVQKRQMVMDRYVDSTIWHVIHRDLFIAEPR